MIAQVSAANISVARTDNITVFNPPPGGGTSPSLPFNIPCVLAQPTAASTQTQAQLGDTTSTVNIAGAKSLTGATRKYRYRK